MSGPFLGARRVWFTEGFDTADLKDAKSLLDELSRQPCVVTSKSWKF